MSAAEPVFYDAPQLEEGFEHDDPTMGTHWGDSNGKKRRYMFIVTEETVTYVIQYLKESKPGDAKQFSFWDDISMVRISFKKVKSGERHVNLYTKRRMKGNSWSAFRNSTNNASLNQYMPSSHVGYLFGFALTMNNKFHAGTSQELVNPGQFANEKEMYRWFLQIPYPMLALLSGEHGREDRYDFVSPVMTDSYRKTNLEDYTKSVVGLRNFKPELIEPVANLKPASAAYLKTFKNVLTDQLIQEFLKNEPHSEYNAKQNTSGVNSPTIGSYQYLSHVKKWLRFSDKKTQQMLLLNWDVNADFDIAPLGVPESIPKMLLEPLYGSIKASTPEEYKTKVTAVFAPYAKNWSTKRDDDNKVLTETLHEITPWVRGTGFTVENDAFRPDNVYGQKGDIFSKKAIISVNNKFAQTVQNNLDLEKMVSKSFPLIPKRSGLKGTHIYLEHVTAEHIKTFVNQVSQKSINLLRRHKVDINHENIAILNSVWMTAITGLGPLKQMKTLPKQTYIFLGQGFTADQILLLLQTNITNPQEAENATKMPKEWFCKMFDIVNPDTAEPDSLY